MIVGNALYPHQKAASLYISALLQNYSDNPIGTELIFGVLLLKNHLVVGKGIV